MKERDGENVFVVVFISFSPVHSSRGSIRERERERCIPKEKREGEEEGGRKEEHEEWSGRGRLMNRLRYK